MFLLLCQQHRSHNVTAAPGCLLTQEMRFSRIFPPFASHRPLAHISYSSHLSLHRLRKPAAHIYSLLQDHVMTKMLIASKCCHTWVMCNHSQNHKGSHLRRCDPSKTTALLCCKCSFCAFKIQPSLNTVMQVTA